LTGSVDSSDLAKLWAVPGVLTVELEDQFRSGVTAALQ